MDILLLVGFIIIAGIILSGFLPTTSKKPNRQDFNYRKNSHLFTKAERSFLGVLEQAVDDGYVVYGKVRVGDILKPEKGLNRSEHQTARNKIDRKHFDFIVCKEDDRSIVCAIELNDKSHRALAQQQRDTLIRKACQSAGLPLLEAPAQEAYSMNEVKEYVMTAIHQSDTPRNAPVENTQN